MNYLLLISIVCFSGYIGKLISKKYVCRDLFFSEMYELCVFIKANINFGLNKIEDIFVEYDKRCNPTSKKYISEIKNHLIKKRKIDNDNLKYNIFWFVKREEILVLNNFVNNLGLGDVYVENEKIDVFLIWLLSKKKDCESMRSQNEALIYKLSVMFGLLICIVIV